MGTCEKTGMQLVGSGKMEASARSATVGERRMQAWRMGTPMGRVRMGGWGSSMERRHRMGRATRLAHWVCGRNVRVGRATVLWMHG